MRQHHRPLQAAPTGANRHILQAARPLLGLDRENKNLRVLAFGDSITEGWIHSAWAKVPWSPRVEQKLQQRLGGDWNIEVVNGGVGSAGVLDRLNDAFRQQLSSAKSSGRPYHFITFEAGINDLLLQNRNAPEIFERMRELWALANAEGSTVAVIPTLPTNVAGEREQQRLALTAKVREYIKHQRAAGNKGLFLIDVESTFAYLSMSPERRAQLFDDGVHLTVYGYELLGDLVARGLSIAMDL
ncbi:SGNH hydrolase-type esterase domain-containing protein [Scenedesmus sp. NREL 46B-D3]|nr:SGNH hydrolase-type esterase domain-containing protein [Scenedesmus sp. NREL 46B-D3]